MENILRNAFYEETDEVFQEIEDCLLEIDSQGSTKTRIDNLFRYVHTLKGSSATMGIEDMAKLTHHLEDVMGKARDGDFELTKEMVSWIFSCLDELRIKVDKHKRMKHTKLMSKNLYILQNLALLMLKIMGI